MGEGGEFDTLDGFGGVGCDSSGEANGFGGFGGGTFEGDNEYEDFGVEGFGDDMDEEDLGGEGFMDSNEEGPGVGDGFGGFNSSFVEGMAASEAFSSDNGITDFDQTNFQDAKAGSEPESSMMEGNVDVTKTCAPIMGKKLTVPAKDGEMSPALAILAEAATIKHIHKKKDGETGASKENSVDAGQKSFETEENNDPTKAEVASPGEDEETPVAELKPHVPEELILPTKSAHQEPGSLDESKASCSASSSASIRLLDTKAGASIGTSDSNTTEIAVPIEKVKMNANQGQTNRTGRSTLAPTILLQASHSSGRPQDSSAKKQRSILFPPNSRTATSSQQQARILPLMTNHRLATKKGVNMLGMIGKPPVGTRLPVATAKPKQGAKITFLNSKQPLQKAPSGMSRASALSTNQTRFVKNGPYGQARNKVRDTGKASLPTMNVEKPMNNSNSVGTLNHGKQSAAPLAKFHASAAGTNKNSTSAAPRKIQGKRDMQAKATQQAPFQQVIPEPVRRVGLPAMNSGSRFGGTSMNPVNTPKDSAMKTPSTKKVRWQTSTSKVDSKNPAAVTPGPDSSKKLSKLAPGFHGVNGAPPQKILPAAVTPNKDERSRDMEAFESNYIEFQRLMQGLEDIHERNDSSLLNMQVLLSTAYAETLQDQGELSVFLGSLGQLNADLDVQLAEYDEFLNSFQNVDATDTTG